MSTTDKTDLRIPLEWAEHYGITGLVAEEWQEHTTYGYGATLTTEEKPDWQRPMTDDEFKRRLHGSWSPTYDESVPRYQRKARVDRTKKMPKFAPTVEAVRDVLGTFRGWVDTTSITQALGEPLGWDRQNTPPNSKVLKALKTLQEEGVVIEQDDVKDRQRIPNARRPEGNSKMWMTVSVYEGLIEDRRLDEAEHERRIEKLHGWLDSLAEGLPVAYSHSNRLCFVDGAFEADADTGKITMDWSVMEQIINLSPRKGPSHG